MGHRTHGFAMGTSRECGLCLQSSSSFFLPFCRLIGAVAFEIWTTDAGYRFDNLVLAQDDKVTRTRVT